MTLAGLLNTGVQLLTSREENELRGVLLKETAEMYSRWKAGFIRYA